MAGVCVCVCDGGRAAVQRGNEELASTKRRVYLMEEACADKTRRTAESQSGMYCDCSIADWTDIHNKRA